MNFDVFNGDADGLCALLQLRLDQPTESTLVTGVKRDIQLLQRVDARDGDHVTVLDISMAKNSGDLQRILERGASVLYIDHHQAGQIPESSQLEAVIDTDANVCTSLLVDRRLEGKYRAWAVAAAFGDNLKESARAAAAELDLTQQQLAQLEELGVCLNYNGYGGDLTDLLFVPDQLFRELLPYTSPFDFIAGNRAVFEALREGYRGDMQRAQALQPDFQTKDIALYRMPDEPWSRRVSGVFANQLANESPDRAHAIVTVNRDQTLTVSVRAPLNNKTGADTLCQSFPTGGGRKAAAGINRLPASELDTFITRFSRQYARP